MVKCQHDADCEGQPDGNIHCSAAGNCVKLATKVAQEKRAARAEAKIASNAENFDNTELSPAQANGLAAGIAQLALDGAVEFGTFLGGLTWDVTKYGLNAARRQFLRTPSSPSSKKSSAKALSGGAKTASGGAKAASGGAKALGSGAASSPRGGQFVSIYTGSKPIVKSKYNIGCTELADCPKHGSRNCFVGLGGVGECVTDAELLEVQSFAEQNAGLVLQALEKLSAKKSSPLAEGAATALQVLETAPSPVKVVEQIVHSASSASDSFHTPKASTPSTQVKYKTPEASTPSQTKYHKPREPTPPTKKKSSQLQKMTNFCEEDADCKGNLDKPFCGPKKRQDGRRTCVNGATRKKQLAELEKLARKSPEKVATIQAQVLDTIATAKSVEKKEEKMAAAELQKAKSSKSSSAKASHSAKAEIHSKRASEAAQVQDNAWSLWGALGAIGGVAVAVGGAVGRGAIAAGGAVGGAIQNARDARAAARAAARARSASAKRREAERRAAPEQWSGSLARRASPHKAPSSVKLSKGKIEKLGMAMEEMEQVGDAKALIKLFGKSASAKKASATAKESWLARTQAALGKLLHIFGAEAEEIKASDSMAKSTPKIASAAKEIAAQPIAEVKEAAKEASAKLAALPAAARMTPQIIAVQHSLTKIKTSKNKAELYRELRKALYMIALTRLQIAHQVKKPRKAAAAKRKAAAKRAAGRKGKKAA